MSWDWGTTQPVKLGRVGLIQVQSLNCLVALKKLWWSLGDRWVGLSGLCDVTFELGFFMERFCIKLGPFVPATCEHTFSICGIFLWGFLNWSEKQLVKFYSWYTINRSAFLWEIDFASMLICTSTTTSHQCFLANTTHCYIQSVVV